MIHNPDTITSRLWLTFAPRAYRATWTIPLASVVFAIAGCFAGTHRAASLSAPVAASDPAVIVFTHCRELVCTQAEVPDCSVEQVVEGLAPYPVRQRIHCVRSGAGTACEERRQLLGGEDTSLENQVMKFGCSGDPVDCSVTGGNATWPTTLGIPRANQSRMSCRAPRPDGPAPAVHPVPGPDTVLEEPALPSGDACFVEAV